MKTFISFLLVSVICLSGCTSQKKVNNEWVSLFNGKDLNDWTVKIRGYRAGDNFANTFRVEDGIMKVRYDGYDKFDNKFGHIFYKQKFSSYKLRVEYRFAPGQAPESPSWAYLNNGVMFHCQSPESMHIDQDFPVSVEAQLRACDDTFQSTTGNVCTPGTEIYIDGMPYEDHCYPAESKLYDAEEWVTFEMVVYADSLVHHIIEGDTILTYTNLTVGGGSVSPTPNIPLGPLKEGYISLQSEGHPTDFRKIEILELD